MKKISIITGISIVFLVIIFAVIYVTSDKQELVHDNTQIQDSPNIMDSITMNTNEPNSFINENGTKTYVINAVDSPNINP